MSDAGLIFNRKKIKYNTLDELIPIEVNETHINIFIDVENLLDLFRIDFYKNVCQKVIEDSNSVMSELFNFIGHYRAYFGNRRSCTTSFYLCYNSQGDRVREELYPDIWKKRIEKTFKPTFQSFLLNKSKHIAKYIPDIHIIDGRTVHSSIIPFVLLTNEANASLQKEVSFFISEDEIFFQYLKYFKEAYMLMASHQSEKLQQKNTFFQYLIKKNNYAVRDERELSITDEFIPFLMAIKGYEGVPILKEKEKQRECIKKTLAFSLGEDMSALGYTTEEISVIRDRIRVFSIEEYFAELTIAEKDYITGQLNNNKLVSHKALFDINNMSLKNKISINTLF